jgi:hypothetical protein
VSVISELWTAMTPDADSSTDGVSGWRGIVPPNWLLGGWWLPWIVGGVASQIAEKMAKDTNDIDSLISSSQWQMLADGLFAISGVFAIALVTMMQKRVRARGAQAKF